MKTQHQIFQFIVISDRIVYSSVKMVIAVETWVGMMA